MNEEKIRKMVSDSFFENIMNNLDSSIIFKYIEGLEKENKQLRKIINKINVFLENHDKNAGKLYYKYDNKYLLSEIKEDIRDILKGVE